MDRPVLMLIVLAFLLLLLGLMLLGWKRRQRSQAAFPQPQGVPADAGAEVFATDALYVATTLADQPLNRVAVAGLGYRSRATVTVTERGLVLAIPGQEPIFILADDIRAVQKATWTIDRVVERDGMVLVRWDIPGDGDTGAEVDSYLRIVDPVIAEQFFTAALQLPSNQTDSTQTGGRAQ